MRHVVSGVALVALAVGCGKGDPVKVKPASPANEPAKTTAPAEGMATTVVKVSGMT